MLPKIDVPVYELKLISSGKKIKFRPFTVKEEKLLLMANESDDANYSLETIKQILNNCIMSDIKISDLPTFDVEYLFLHLRARSVGEVVKLKYKCNNLVQKEEKEEQCGNLVEVQVDLLDIEPEQNPKHNPKIEITPKLGIVMKYPKMEVLQAQDPNEEEMTLILNMILECIDYIYDEESIYYAKDSTKEELMEFIDSLQSKDLEKIKDFFDTMPKLKKKIHFECKKCGYQEDFDVEGIQSFFG